MSVVAFGEIMLRLTPLNYRDRLRNTRAFDVNFAGAESNVSLLLAQLGHHVEFVTCLPQNTMGESCVDSLKGNGIGTRHVVRSGNRIGIYFIEAGSSIRPSRVEYDRKNSSISEIQDDTFKWDSILNGCQWFHTSGITPALSDVCARETLRAMEMARKLGAKVSFDLNYRRTLWEPAKAKSVLKEMIGLSDLLIGNAGVMSDLFDFKSESDTTEDTIRAARQVAADFEIPYVAFTHRAHHSASRNEVSAVLVHGEEVFRSRSYDVDIADRFGTGDAFAGGLIHGFLKQWDHQRALEFASACFAFKHTIAGDHLVCSETEVDAIVKGQTSGHVQR